MGKIAEISVLLVQLISSVAGILTGATPSDHVIDLGRGDERSRGHRAMAFLAALFSSLSLLLGVAIVHMFIRSLDATLVLGLILLSLASFFSIHLPLERWISRREKQGADGLRETSQPKGSANNPRGRE